MSRGPRTGVFLLEDAWRGVQTCLRSAGQELPKGIAGIEAMRDGPFRAPEQLLRIAASHNGGRLARTLTFARPFPYRAVHSTRTRGPSMVVDRDRVLFPWPPPPRAVSQGPNPRAHRCGCTQRGRLGTLTGAWPGGSPAACERRKAHSVRTTRLRHLKHPRKDGDARGSQDLRANRADCDCASDASAWWAVLSMVARWMLRGSGSVLAVRRSRYLNAMDGETSTGGWKRCARERGWRALETAGRR
ncbi:hypothetical protein C8Q74DRAFT_999716 [Fomes fomentarius]|nr:hypothetical protein C8Q74DRAFT_999716 [Fomes fomentarius]